MSPIRRERSRWRPTPDGKILAEEAEQFLNGELAGELLVVGAPVPAWAWLAFLAHTRESELELRLDELVHLGRFDTNSLLWQGAVALLVQEMVHTAERSGCTIGDLQETLVAVLEAESGRAAAIEHLGPHGFVQMVCSVLVRCRHGADG